MPRIAAEEITEQKASKTSVCVCVCVKVERLNVGTDLSTAGGPQ